MLVGFCAGAANTARRDDGGQPRRAGHGGGRRGQWQVVTAQCLHGLRSTRTCTGVRQFVVRGITLTAQSFGILASGAQLGGYVEVSGRVAYAPQQAWIMNATVKVRHM